MKTEINEHGRTRWLQNLKRIFPRKSRRDPAGTDIQRSQPENPNDSTVIPVSSPQDVRVHADSIEGNSVCETLVDSSDILRRSSNLSGPKDLWSAAFREAVDLVKQQIDISRLEGKSVAQMFEELGKIEESTIKNDAFLRGVQKLKAAEVPLQNFKFALDLAAPLTALEPTTMTVFGVIKSVTAIAISLASIDLDFAKQIGQMLGHISYIDECDTYGRRTDRSNIHTTLVSVYQKILEFYHVVSNVLTKRGPKLLLKMTLEKEHLPEIIREFVELADRLQRHVDNATHQIVQEIEDILKRWEIFQWLGRENLDRQHQHHGDLRDLRRLDDVAAESSSISPPSLGDQACAFLLADKVFKEWCAPDGTQHLVLIGDMGCGKSVAMSFLVDELKRRSKQNIPQPKVCFYYCRDGWTSSAIDIYSVLILQVLDQLQGLNLTFYEWYKEINEEGFNPAKDANMLGDFLLKVAESLDRPLFIVIDGIDECDKPTLRKLINLLGSLAKKNSRLKTLVASRPSSEILKQVSFMDTLEMVNDSQRDQLIAEHTVTKRLPHLDSDIQSLVAGNLSRAAQGSAIWTKLMVEFIGIREITARVPMQNFLENKILPFQLSDLYEALLRKCTMGVLESEALAIVALQLLSAARRPLSISELGSAVALATSDRKITTVTALAGGVDNERILRLIRPFIAHTDFADTTNRQLRLVHQSVKEFVDTRSNPRQPTDEDGHGIFPRRHAQQSEHCILQVCIKYLLLDEVGEASLFSEEQEIINDLPQADGLFDDAIAGAEEYTTDCSWEDWEMNMVRFDPVERGFGEFFVYASCHWVDHLGSIEAEGLPSLADLERLCQTGSIRLRNWIEQKRRPDCVLQARFPFDYKLYDPLSISSLYASKDVLFYMLEHSKLDGIDFQEDTITKAVNQIQLWCGPERLAMFMQGLSARTGHSELVTTMH